MIIATAEMNDTSKYHRNSPKKMTNINKTYAQLELFYAQIIIEPEKIASKSLTEKEYSVNPYTSLLKPYLAFCRNISISKAVRKPLNHRINHIRKTE